MGFSKINLPPDMIETLNKIYINAKEKNPNLTESSFVEYIIAQWLEQFEIKQEAETIPKDKALLKNNIKTAIKYSDKSQKQIAHEVGINPSYLSQIVSGKYDPSIKVVLLLLQALNYPPSKVGELFHLDPAH